MIQTHLSSHPMVAAAVLSLFALGALGLGGCKDKDAGGLVADAAFTTAPVDAAVAVDISQCAGCQLLSQPSWVFQGIYRDAACTEPLAQLVASACAAVPALGPATLTYVDEIGSRKAGESASIALGEQVAPEAARYRKAGKDCAPANEAAVHVTPMACGASKVCRDSSGALACTNCRTLSNGCPDFEETRMYATINDPAIKGATTGGGGGGNVGRLSQCCAALAAEAKRMGSSPEAGMLNSAAVQCVALAKAAGPTGTAPELGALRAALAGRKVPAICAGF